MAYVKQVPAATAQLATAKQKVTSAKSALAAEKKSHAISAAVTKAAQGAKSKARLYSGGSSRSDSTRASRRGKAAYASVINSANAAEVGRINTAMAKLNAAEQAVIDASNALQRAMLADDAEAARAEMAALAAEQRALLVERDTRLAGRIDNNTTGIDINSQRIGLDGVRINAVEGAASSPKTALFKPSAADKAAAVVLDTKAKAISKKAIELAAVDTFATAQAALTRLSAADQAALKKKSPLPAVAGALIGFKLGGIYGAAIGAGAGLMIKGKG